MEKGGTLENKMYDIHMHLIPGVDDGAASEKMAAEMFQMSRSQGVVGIFATPHSSAFLWSFDRTMENYKVLQSLVKKQAKDLELYLGCEVYLENGGMDDIISALDAGRIPTMNGAKYVLSEFSPWTDAQSVVYCAERLICAGYLPIIAHAERYNLIQGDEDVIEKLREMGCLIQINVYSVYDEKNDQIRTWANRLVAGKKVDFLGSDAHRTDHRPPIIESGLGYLYKTYDKAYIDRIALENPRSLLIK